MKNAGANNETAPPTDAEAPTIILSEAVEAVEKAVVAYRDATASMRGTRSLIRRLYAPHGNGKVRYTGRSASDILEDYLTGSGFGRESQIFYDLSRIVMDYAELGEFSQDEIVYWCIVSKIPYKV